MEERRHRVLIISRRPLVAQVIKGLLEGEDIIAEVDIAENYHAALRQAATRPPDAVVIDLPRDTPFFVERPITVRGREILTLVLEEGCSQTRLYVHAPGTPANLQNLLGAIRGEALQVREEPAQSSSGELEPFVASEPDIPHIF